MTDISTMTPEQRKALMQQLAKEEKAEKAKKAKAKKAYEKDRDTSVEELFSEAEQISLAMARFKTKMHAVMEKQQEKLNEYGGVRSDSKGGFSLTHTDGTMRVTRRRDTDPTWDERANKAEELIRSFLSDSVKKSNKEMYELLMTFIARNDKGELEYASVMRLIQHEHLYNDPRWIEGLQLIKESYRILFKAYSYEFKFKNPVGKWERLKMNFSEL
ncbi:DUF3164 family protein [Sphingobacterium cellulitidis]|uniref:DUF3164 family protein n=1 Tax=Sphingobacterium cellulitidis TaxID=1768011 RepID=UPI00370D92E0